MKTPPTIVVQIVHIHGPRKGDIQEFTADAITIGRHPSCHVRFPADLTAVSRKHAEIHREGNRFKILDKNSTNGTYVNGKKISEVFLKDGDVIAFAEIGPKVSFLTQIQGSVVGAEELPGKPESEQPVVAPPPEPETEEVPVGSVHMPLVVQYGPTLRSFKELPIVIGKGSRADLVLPHPALCDRHVQIFFWQGRYYVKDLTGQKAVRVNQSPIGVQAPLNPDDELSLSTQGPTFRFLGEGRLMELEHPEQEAERPATGIGHPAKQESTPSTPDSKSSPSLFKRFFH